MSDPPMMPPPPPMPPPHFPTPGSMSPPHFLPVRRQFPPVPFLPPVPHFPLFTAAGPLPDHIVVPDELPPKGTTEARHGNSMIVGSKDGSGDFFSNHVPSPNAKQSVKAKPTKLVKSGSCPPDSNDEGLEISSSGPNPSTCRYDSSLGLLAKKFVALLQQAEDGSLDLKEAAKILEVQKRRIYDITNVLEGVGLIEKSLKNQVTWKVMDVLKPSQLDAQVSEIKAELENMDNEEIRLDERIREMQERLMGLTEDENSKRWLYVTNKDITKLPCFQNDTLIAIKAPHGAMLEVPHPVDASCFPAEQYKLLLRSATGPIDCFLLSNVDGVEEMDEDLRTEGPAEFSGGCKNGEMDTTMTWISRGDDNRAAHKDVTGCSSPSRSSVGLTKIVTCESDDDTDYWLLTDDGGGSITKIWNAGHP